MMKWVLLLMLWNIPNVEEERAGWNRARTFDTLEQCLVARKQAVESLHTNGGYSLICFPKE